MKIMPKEIPSEKSIAAGATIVAVFSLFISIRSCQQADKSVRVAEQTLELTRAEFQDARSLLWTGVIENNRKLKLSPTNREANISDVWVNLPSALTPSTYQEMSPPTFIVDLETVHRALERYINDSLGVALRDSAEASLITWTVPVPIEVTSGYIIGNNSYRTHALYELSYTVVGPSKKRKRVVFTSFSFRRHLSLEELEKLGHEESSPADEAWAQPIN